jgi:WD40-like Beta Propeller Repeat
VSTAFFSASGNSLATQITADSIRLDPASASGLLTTAMIAQPSTGKLEPFVPMQGHSGLSALSRDDEHVAYEFAATDADPTSIWETDLKTCETTELDSSPPYRDVNPAWRPDGKEILFLQYQITGPAQIATRLVSLPIPPGQPEILFGPDEEVGGGFAFSPDGTRFAMEAQGLKVVDRQTLAETVIFPASALPAGFLFVTGALAWSPTLNLIAFELCAGPGPTACQLWTIRPDGTGGHRILTAPQSIFRFSSFVRDSPGPAPAGFVPYHGGCSTAAPAPASARR